MTSVELKYKDSKSGDEWVWPLKYLRKYGCDRDIFSFEAGRKCPGGEGLYAFSTKKASQLFDMVARNISEGGLEGEGGGMLSPPNGHNLPSNSPESLASPPVPALNPPPVPTSDPPTHPPPTASASSAASRLPEYQNMNYHQDGQPFLTNGNDEPPRLVPPSSPTTTAAREHRASAASATPSPPPRVNYAEITLQEPTDPVTLPKEVDGEKRVSYSQIDIKQTEEYHKQIAKIQAQNVPPLPNLGTGEFKIVTPTDRRGTSSRGSPRPSSASTSSPSSSSAAHRTMSDGNFSVSGGNSSSHKKAHSPGPRDNGLIPGRSYSHSASSVSDSAAHHQQMYQNVSISKTGTVASVIPEVNETASPPPPPPSQLQQQQVNYMNYTPQQTNTSASSASRINTTPQPSMVGRRESELKTPHRDTELQTYENLRVGKGVTSPPSAAAHHTTSPPRMGGPAMALYADLDLKSPSGTSTPKVTSHGNNDSKEVSHATLIFPSTPTTPATTGGGGFSINKSRSRTSTSPPPSNSELQLPSPSTGPPGRGRSATELPSSSVDMVQYAAMDFPVMEALRKTKKERDQEIRERTEEEAREEERRKREEAERLANPGKKKGKKEKKKKDRRNSNQ